MAILTASARRGGGRDGSDGVFGCIELGKEPCSLDPHRFTSLKQSGEPTCQIRVQILIAFPKRESECDADDAAAPAPVISVTASATTTTSTAIEDRRGDNRGILCPLLWVLAQSDNGGGPPPSSIELRHNCGPRWPSLAD
jgi:hypothetical protein